MKLDFFVYAINSEIFKIIDFIDERLPGIGVFQTKFAEKLFNKLLKYLNIEDTEFVIVVLLVLVK